MRYALVDGIKTEATPKAQGKCLCCGAEVIAKCGDKRAWHWAHKNNEECNYSKKDAKTPWHENWQKQFPPDWCEVRCTDEQTGEIHIADIKTTNGLVVEFQHSAINPEERSSREQFHKNMIWVVDGTKCKYDFVHFGENLKNLELFATNKEKNILLYKVKIIDNFLPERWRTLKVPTYFDFRIEKTDDIENEKEKILRNLIWGFFRIEQQIFAVSMPHVCFVDYIKQNRLNEIYNYVLQKENLYKILIAEKNKRNNFSGRYYRQIVFSPNANPRSINCLKSKYPGSRF